MENKFFIFALMIFLVALAPSVYALGVTPGRTTVDFSPNLKRTVDFSIVNTESKEMNVAFSVEGDLSEYVSVPLSVVHFSADEKMKKFDYNFSLPDNLSSGLHKAKITALELPPDINDSGMVVRATVSVATQLYVYVPYPGKYIDAKFDIVTDEDNNLVKFYIPFVSRGEEKIDSVKAVIEIYKGGEKVASLNTNELSVNSRERRELSAIWDPKVSPGKYKAKVKVSYDGKTLEFEKEFSVGKSFLGVLGISVNNFHLGDVAKIRLLVQNTLSESIKKAVAKMNVYDSDLNGVAKLKSEDYEIPPKSNKEMILYWDTEGLDKGRYDSELKVNYDEKVLDKKFKVDVDENSMSFTGVGFAVSSGEGNLSMSSLLGIVVGLLLLTNLIWFIWWKRQKKRK